ncbi:nucleoside diphosphate kinase homolog 5 [Chelonus insularis]|uniref:nucleoside diphosphate kinase homolog 5 n=1 Tax=Chelonus insularis TaxID=460826 RepID=UPI00158A0DFE|nr:nucleoside diphosphate kinase homolog 5 [Chelonus insularis]
MCDCLETKKICPFFHNHPYESNDDEDDDTNKNSYENEDNIEENSSELSFINEHFEGTKESSGELDNFSENNYENKKEEKCDDDPNQKWKVVAKKLKTCQKSKKKKSKQERDIEFTLAIIKPDALQYRRIIKKIIIDEGFEICNEKKLQMTADQMFEFYSRKDEKSELSTEIDYMVSGPIIVLVLCKHQAVNDWIDLIGPQKVSDAILYFPDSIRAKFGNKQDDYKNAVHGSTSYKIAQEEIKFFFPNFIFEPILTGYGIESYLQNNICEILSKGIIHCCKEKSEDPLLCLSKWLLDNNPNKPKTIIK